MKKSYWTASLVAVFFEFLTKQAALWGWVLLVKFIYVLIGIIFGWVVGLVLGGTILGILAQIGITGFSMWQIGAFLGFIGSFLGSSNNFHQHNQINQDPRYNQYH